MVAFDLVLLCAVVIDPVVFADVMHSRPLIAETQIESLGVRVVVAHADEQLRLPCRDGLVFGRRDQPPPHALPAEFVADVQMGEFDGVGIGAPCVVPHAAIPPQ